MSANPEGRAATDPEIPDILPLLPIRDLVVFPYMIVPLRVTRPVSMEAVAKALEAEERLCFLVAQRDSTDEEPAASSFYRSGTIGMIMRMRKLSEGGLKILVQGLCRAKIQKFVSDSPCYRVRIDRNEDPPPARTLGSEALLRSVRGNVDKLTGLGKSMQPELGMVVGSVEDPGRMADLVASNLTLKVNEAQELLELDNPIERLTRVNQNLEKEIGILEVQSQIQNRAKEEMSKTQRDYYLREQLRQIRNELGDGDVHGEEMEELRAKVLKADCRTRPRPRPTSRSAASTRCTRRAPRRRCCARISTGSPSCPGPPAARTRWTSTPRARSSTRITTTSSTSRTASSITWRCASCAAACTGRSSASSVRPASARRRWDDRSRARSAASSCASRSAACATRRRSAAIGAPTSARCPGA